MKIPQKGNRKKENPTRLKNSIGFTQNNSWLRTVFQNFRAHGAMKLLFLKRHRNAIPPKIGLDCCVINPCTFNVKAYIFYYTTPR